MIKNQFEYQLAKAEARKCSKTLKEVCSDEHYQSEINPKLYQIQKDSVENHLEDLNEEIREYEENNRPCLEGT